jgi:DNA-binding transcriptional MerR regulator
VTTAQQIGGPARQGDESAADTTQRLLTIGTVCGLLKEEFPDISISKIRYLEDQGLLAPRRTQGGYRLFSEGDVERLRTILRLQRDEFLPLRVIRQELASPSTGTPRRRRPLGLSPDDGGVRLGELCNRAGVTPELIRELEEFGLIEPRADGGLYGEADVEIAAVCGKLARYGVAPRNLRAFKTGAGREAALLEQLVAPALRSRNPERRKSGLEDLEELASLAQGLAQALFWRDLRQLVAPF